MKAKLKLAVTKNSRFVFGVLILLAVAFGGVQNRLSKFSGLELQDVPAPPRYWGLSVDPQIVNHILGLRLLIADLVWIDALVKSDTTQEQESYSNFYRVFRTIVRLDPDNTYAYYVGGSYLSIIKNDVKGATAILRDGVKRIADRPSSWAGAWRVPFTLGYNLIFEEQEIEEGSEAILQAARMPGAPDTVRKLADRVATESGRLEVASRVLGMLYSRVNNAMEKQRIETKMLVIANKQDLLELNEKFERFRSTTGAFALSKPRQFQLFMKSVGHPKTDLFGRPIELNRQGKISSQLESD